MIAFMWQVDFLFKNSSIENIRNKIKGSIKNVTFFYCINTKQWYRNSQSQINEWEKEYLTKKNLKHFYLIPKIWYLSCLGYRKRKRKTQSYSVRNKNYSRSVILQANTKNWDNHTTALKIKPKLKIKNKKKQNRM